MPYIIRINPARRFVVKGHCMVISPSANGGVRVGEFTIDNLDELHDLIRPTPEWNIDPVDILELARPEYLEFVGDIEAKLAPLLKNFCAGTDHITFKSCSAEFVSLILDPIRLYEKISFEDCTVPLNLVLRVTASLSLSRSTCTKDIANEISSNALYIHTLSLHFPVSNSCFQAVTDTIRSLFVYGTAEVCPEDLLERVAATRQLKAIYIYGFFWDSADIKRLTISHSDRLTLGGHLVQPSLDTDQVTKWIAPKDLDFGKLDIWSPSNSIALLRTANEFREISLPKMRITNELLLILQSKGVEKLEIHYQSSIAFTEDVALTQVKSVIAGDKHRRRRKTLMAVFPNAEILYLL